MKFQISTLIFIKNQQDQYLLLERNKIPNKGCWSPVGGKLEISEGESPFECAIREVREETKFEITHKDLHLWGYVSEKSYEGKIHCLLLLFNCRKIFFDLPVDIVEGNFAWWTRRQIDQLKIPQTDRKFIWPYYDTHRDQFVAIKADCDLGHSLKFEIEEAF